MNLVFDLGDIIVILAVIVAFIVFRTFDKNNRSLEKVKKYSERIKEDLNVYVQNLSQPVRSVGDDVQTHTENAQRLVGEIRAIESGLNERAADIDSLRVRIEEYGTALHTLEQATQRVQENLGEIEKESPFVRDVSKKLKDASGQIAQVERDIAGIHKHFEKANGDAVQRLESRVVTAIQEKLRTAADQAAQTEGKVRDFAAYIARLEVSRESIERDAVAQMTKHAEETELAIRQSRALNEKEFSASMEAAGKDLARSFSAYLARMEEVEKDYHDRLEQVAQRGSVLEEDALKKLKSYILQQSEAVRQAFQGDIAALRNLAETEREKLASRFGEMESEIRLWEEDAKKDLSDGKASIAEAIADWDNGIQLELKKRGSVIDDSCVGMKHTVDAFEKETAGTIRRIEQDLSKKEEIFEARIASIKDQSEGRFDTVFDRVIEVLDKRAQEVQAALGEKHRKLQDTATATADAIAKSYAGLEKESADKFSIFKTQYGEKIQELLSLVEKYRISTDKNLGEYVAKSDKRMEAVEEDLEARFQTLAEKAKTFENRIQTSVMDAETSIRDYSEQMKSEMRENLVRQVGELKADIQAQLKAIRKEVADAENAIDASIEERRQLILRSTVELQAGVRDAEKSVQDRMETVGKSTDEKVKLLSERFAVLKADFDKKFQELSRIETEFSDRLGVTAEQVESKVMLSLDEKLAEYEDGFLYRFNKIEKVNGDLDALDKNLKDSIEVLRKKSVDDLEAFHKTLDEKRNAERTRMEAQLSVLGKDIEKLDKSLSELRNKALQSASEKLKLTENEFFRELQDRGMAMRTRMGEWEIELKKQLDKLSVKSVDERKAVEVAYAEEMKSGLASLQSRFFDQVEKLETQMGGFKESVTDRIGTNEARLDEFEENIKRSLKEAENASRSLFQRDFKATNEAFGETFRKFERDAETRIGKIADEVTQSKENVLGMFEAARVDLSQWQAKTYFQIKETTVEVNERIAALKEGVGATVASLREEFQSQREDLVVSTHEERLALKSEIKELADKVSELSETLRQKTEGALETFAKGYDTTLLDYQKRTRDFQLENDQRIKDARTSLNEVKEKTEGLQKKLFDKIQESADQLTANLGEIEKQIKAFTAQTKIFERADVLKQSLESGLADMRAEIQKLETQRKEVKELDVQYAKTKKTADEVTAKLNRFLADKRRIDDMENDFKKLLGLSKTIDMKLVQAHESNDMLQEIQTRLRDLESLGKEVESQYSRLEKKKEIIETTADGVDRNFQKLQEVEKSLSLVEGDLEAVPPKLVKIGEEIKLLSKNREKTEKAVEWIGKIDTSLAEIEERMGEIQKAREWLARTETRLEEINRQAKEQIKLFETLVKSDLGKGGKQEKSAPSNDIRQTVIKLSRQGWSPDEIVRATKLSRGEVELILELAPKKG